MADGTILSYYDTGPNGIEKRVRISGYELCQLDKGGLIENSKGHLDSAEYVWIQRARSKRMSEIAVVAHFRCDSF